MIFNHQPTQPCRVGITLKETSNSFSCVLTYIFRVRMSCYVAVQFSFNRSLFRSLHGTTHAACYVAEHYQVLQALFGGDSPHSHFVLNTGEMPIDGLKQGKPRGLEPVMAT